MIEKILEMMKEVEKNDEFFEVVARMMKKTYDNLIKVGFSPEQAILITGVIGNMKK